LEDILSFLGVHHNKLCLPIRHLLYLLLLHIILNFSSILETTQVLIMFDTEI